MNLNNTETEYVKLENNAKSCMRISAAVIFAVILIPASVTVLLIFEAGVLGKIILGICWALAIAYVIGVPNVRYERYRYCIDEEAIRVRQGFLWITEQVVPIERLHKITVSQGPVDRIFKISKVCVTTAGGDVTIKFLKDEKAADIAETLKKKINDIAVMEREQ